MLTKPDAAHNMTQRIDVEGTSYYTYDDLERLLTVTDAFGKVTGYTYDEAGNRETETVTEQGDETVTTYSYNTQNRLTGSVAELNDVTSETVSYTYDNNGSQTVKTVTPYINGIPQTPVATTSTFDVFNRLLTTEDPLGHVVSRTYDDAGNVNAKTDGRNKTTDYAYDEFNRLVTVTNALDEVTSYTYDLCGPPQS